MVRPSHGQSDEAKLSHGLTALNEPLWADPFTIKVWVHLHLTRETGRGVAWRSSSTSGSGRMQCRRRRPSNGLVRRRSAGRHASVRRD